MTPQANWMTRYERASAPSTSTSTDQNWMARYEQSGPPSTPPSTTTNNWMARYEVGGNGLSSLHPPPITPAPPPLDSQGPGLLHQLWEGLLQTGVDAKNYIKFAITHPQAFAPGTAQYAPDLAVLHDTDPEQAQSVLRGGALVASTVMSGGAAAALTPLAAGLKSKAAAFLVSEAIGGGTYGGLRPLEEGETRGQAIKQDAAFFAAFGVAFKAGGALTKGLLRKVGVLPPLKGHPGVEPPPAPPEPPPAPVGEPPPLRGAPLDRVTEPARSLVEQESFPPYPGQVPIDPGLNVVPVLPPITGLQAPVEVQAPGFLRPDVGEGRLQSSRPFQAQPLEAVNRVEGLQPVPAPGQFAEPRAVDLGTPPIEGYQSTALGGAKPRGTPPTVEELALLNDMADQAVAEIKPLDLLEPMARQEAEQITRGPSLLLADALSEPAGEGALEAAFARFLREVPPEQEAARLLDLVAEQPAMALSGEAATRQAQRAGKILGRESQLFPELAPGGRGVRFAPLDGIQAPSLEGVLPDTPPWTAWDIAGKINQPGLDAIARATLRVANEAGAVTMRSLLGITGTGLYVAGAMDSDLPDSWQAGLKGVGIFLAAGALGGPALRRTLAKPGRLRNMMLLNSPTALMDGSLLASVRQAESTLAQGGMQRQQIVKEVQGLFRREVWDNQGFGAYILDEGVAAPEWGLLTSTEQQAMLGIRALWRTMGEQGQQHGFLRELQEEYFHRIWPRGSQQYVSGMGAGRTGAGGIAEHQAFPSLRAAEAYAKEKGIAGPSRNMAVALGHYFDRWYQAMAMTNLIRTAERLGALKPAEALEGSVSLGSQIVKLPEGWRPLTGVPSLRGQVAPEALAQVIENLAGANRWQGGVFKALDAGKGVLMRFIMMWPWEHGLNVTRAGLASLGTAAINPAAFRRAAKAIRDNLPGAQEAVNHGVMLGGRPDLLDARTLMGTFDNVIAKAANVPGGGVIAPTIRAIVQSGDRLFEMSEHALWRTWVPTTQLMTFQREMIQFTKRTGGQFGPKTAQYEEAARRAATLANTVVGMIPRTLKDARMQQTLSLVLFSPDWTKTRAALWGRAAGEVGAMASGELKWGEARYAQIKTRQALLGVAFATAMGYLWTGRWPVFNPRGQKFYVPTGITDDRGNEVGIDLLGYWQDDIKAAGNPIQFLYDRSNPLIRLTTGIVQQRTGFGQAIGPQEMAGEITKAVGPLGEVVNLGLQKAAGADLSPADQLRSVSGLLATGNVARIPSALEATIAKLADRTLREARVPVNQDRLYDLSRLIRSNYLEGRSALSGEALYYLASQRRLTQRQNPGVWLFKSVRDWMVEQFRKEAIEQPLEAPAPAPVPQ